MGTFFKWGTAKMFDYLNFRMYLKQRFKFFTLFFLYLLEFGRKLYDCRYEQAGVDCKRPLRPLGGYRRRKCIVQAQWESCYRNNDID